MDRMGDKKHGRNLSQAGAFSEAYEIFKALAEKTPLIVKSKKGSKNRRKVYTLPLISSPFNRPDEKVAIWRNG